MSNDIYFQVRLARGTGTGEESTITRTIKVTSEEIGNATIEDCCWAFARRVERDFGSLLDSGWTPHFRCVVLTEGTEIDADIE